MKRLDRTPDSRPLLNGLLPQSAVVVERFQDHPEPGLFPEEAALVSGAVEKRQLEFATVRTCAREAFGRLGVPAAPILPLGEDAPAFGRRAPRWPAGIVGSMTHCDGYRGAALAHATELVSLGVDAEPHNPLPTRVIAAIATPEERESLSALRGAEPAIAWERILFSAKESVYKAFFSLTARSLACGDCTITLTPEGSFVARVLPSDGGPTEEQRELTGRWRLRRGGEGAGPGLVGTALAVLN